MKYIVFVDPEYVRDAQILAGEPGDDPNDPDAGWVDAGGGLVVGILHADGPAELWEWVSAMYPEADVSVFKFAEIKTMPRSL